MDTGKRGRGRPRLYDWAGLFASDSFVLRPGIHYACKAISIVRQLRLVASARGIKLSVVVDKSRNVRVKVLREEVEPCRR